MTDLIPAADRRRSLLGSTPSSAIQILVMIVLAVVAVDRYLAHRDLQTGVLRALEDFGREI